MLEGFRRRTDSIGLPWPMAARDLRQSAGRRLVRRPVNGVRTALHRQANRGEVGHVLGCGGGPETANERLTQVNIAWPRSNGCSSEQAVSWIWKNRPNVPRCKLSTRASGFVGASIGIRAMTWPARLEIGLGNRHLLEPGACWSRRTGHGRGASRTARPSGPARVSSPLHALDGSRQRDAKQTRESIEGERASAGGCLVRPSKRGERMVGTRNCFAKTSCGGLIGWPGPAARPPTPRFARRQSGRARRAASVRVREVPGSAGVRVGSVGHPSIRAAGGNRQAFNKGPLGVRCKTLLTRLSFRTWHSDPWPARQRPAFSEA
jgi:hypothetical protein